MSHSVGTGLTTGSFHTLRVRASNGVMTNILTLLGNAGGGITNLTVAGGGMSVSGSGVTRTLTVDLSSYATSAQVASSIVAALASFTNTVALTTLLNAKEGTITTGTFLSKTGSTLNVDLSSFTNTAALTTLLNAKEDNLIAGTFLSKTGSTLNVDMSSFTNTAALTTLLNAKEDNLTAGTFLNKTGSTLNVDLTSFTNTAALTTLLNAKEDNLTAGTFLSKTGSTLNVDLSSFTNTAQMNTLLNMKQDTILAGTNVTKTGNTLAVTDLGSLAFKYATNVSVLLAISNANKMLWNNVRVFDATEVNGVAANCTSITGPFTFTTDTVLGQRHFTWSIGYQHASLAFAGTSKILSNVTNSSIDYLSWGGDYLATIPVLNAGLASQFTLMNAAVNQRQPLITGDLNVPGSITLSTIAITSSYGQPILSCKVGTINYLSLGFGVTTLGSNNAAEALTISRTGDVIATVSCTNSSDARLKTDIQPIDPVKCQALFDRVNAVTYQRVDLPGEETRVGFLAQDFVDESFPNLVGTRPNDWTLTLDYARLTSLLWQQCKNMQHRIEALEGKKKKTVKSK